MVDGSHRARPLKGVERDRVMIRSAALRVIRRIENWPKFKDKNTRRDWLAPPPTAAFKRLEPFGFGLSDGLWLFHPDDYTADVVWPLNVAWVVEGEEGARFTMMKVRTITTKEARGYASRFGPYMVRSDAGQVEDGRLMTMAGVWVWLGGQWCDADGSPRWKGRSDDAVLPQNDSGLTDNDRRIPRFATGVALRQRYEWAVALGLEGSPSVRFATDPTGIKDIFRIRDLPEGRDRRAALMTWVEDHWRQDRTDPELEGYVRKHLRGLTSFTWQGMAGEVIPAQFDMDMRDRFIAERAAMKAAGQDRRAKAA